MVWIIVILCIVITTLVAYIANQKKQLHEISLVLDDIYAGNLDRRLLAHENTSISQLAYKINDIIIRDKNKLLEVTKSEQAYRKLVTSLSHDIRTPLASLIGYLEVLEHESVSEEEHDQFLKIAKLKALTLSDYIQSLFEWLKLESGEWVYHFERENICELTRLILADWIIRLEKNNIQFQFDIPEKPLYFIADKKAYERILNNVLSNTIKHSKADLLNISLSSKDDTITLIISDNGIGIADEDIPFVFDRLYKCDHSRNENSNGLGLAIAKELMSLLNGEITVESSLHAGTSFLLTFPQNMNKA